MGFFDQFRRSDLAKARKEAERNPNPITIEALCRALIAQSDLDGALEQAEKGLQRFPESDRLITIIKSVKKNQLGPKIAELKEAVRTNPTPMLYRQLAELYREIGDDQRALDTCLEVRERYPKDENTFLVMGEIYHERFTSSYLASDGKQAIENLQQACDLNRNNYNALIKLAELYLVLGMFKKAVPQLKAIVNFAPADNKVKTLLGKANQLSAKHQEEEDIDILLRTVEEREAPYFVVAHNDDGSGDIQPHQGGRAAVGDSNVVQKVVEEFDLGESLTTIVAFDRDLKALGVRSSVDVDLRTYVDAVRGMVDVLVKQAPQLAMGGFRRGVLETPEMGVQILSFPGGFLYIVTPAQARSEGIEQSIGELIGRLTA